MPRADDNRYSVEALGINQSLFWQTNKRVPVTLDLIPDKFAIDDSDIHSRRALGEPKLLNDQRVSITGV
ncbi:MAG: hypothetical protein DWQ34_13255 [Planctomycetota bacterium]|nr:MAG: hypothetical protein DWQ34_13255 [Planctomycetota bacterium]